MDSSRDDKTISVVIPAYNSVDTIERALKSVYAQTYDDIIEVIVVDDGSTDDTVDLISREFPDAKCIGQANAGRAVARNAGVAVASGDYISFLDADDEYMPEKIARQVDTLHQHPGIDILLCHGHLIEADTPDSPIPSSSEEQPAEGLQHLTFRSLFQTLTPDIGIGNSGWLIARELYQQLGGQRGEFVRLQDVEFLLRAAGLGYTVAVMPNILCVYHRSGSKLASHNPAFARAAATILREYDPAGAGWQADLLDRHTYERYVMRQLCASAAILGACGETGEAGQLIEEARAMPSQGIMLRLRLLVAQYLPSMYCRIPSARR